MILLVIMIAIVLDQNHEPKYSELIFTSRCSIFSAMRFVRLGLAVFLILFAMADIAMSGACCNEDAVDPAEEEATCFCCCSHVTVEHVPELTVDIAERPVIGSYLPSDTFSFPLIVYHPPRSN